MALIGLPQINGITNPGNILSTGLTLLQGAAWSALAAETKWGIYQDGKEVVLGKSSSLIQQAATAVGLGGLISSDITIDSVIEIAHRKRAEVSNYRIETGSFASFNKVETPRQIPIRLAKGGAEFGRQSFLIWLENNVRAASLFDILIPEVSYKNLTLVDYSYRRVSTDGVTLIIADCMFQEILQATFKRGTSDAKNAQDKPIQAMSSIAANPPSATALSKLSRAVGL